MALFLSDASVVSRKAAKKEEGMRAAFYNNVDAGARAWFEQNAFVATTNKAGQRSSAQCDAVRVEYERKREI